jgi:hypothetical protein
MKLSSVKVAIDTARSLSRGGIGNRMERILLMMFFMRIKEYISFMVVSIIKMNF